MKEKVVSPAEYLVRTAIRVEVHAKNASGIGTGFFMKIPLDNQRFIPVIVSNRHLLAADNVQKYVLCFYEINEKSDRVGMRKIETTPFESPLSTHSDPNCDLAAINITSILNRNDGKIDFVPVDPKWIPNKWELLDAIEDLIMIGYPGDIYLKTDDPVVRRGISATPIGSKFEGGEKFLADIPVFSGSSGSPIFIFNPTGGFSRNEDGSWVVRFGAPRIHFVGIQSRGFFFDSKIVQKMFDEKNRLQEIEVQGLSSKTFMNVAIVERSSQIQSLLNDVKTKLLEPTVVFTGSFSSDLKNFL